MAKKRIETTGRKSADTIKINIRDEVDDETNSRAARRREERAERRAEAAAKKAEARRLAKQEEDELERKSTRKVKVTAEALRRRMEEENLAMQRRLEEEKRKQSRSVDEKEYLKMVTAANTNRDDSLIEASTVEGAIAQLTALNCKSSSPVDKTKFKSSFKVFEKAELETLKEEKPGLTLGQYKDMILKLWKKSQDRRVAAV